MQPRLEAMIDVIILLYKKEQNWINCINKFIQIFLSNVFGFEKVTYCFDWTNCLFNYICCFSISTLSTGCHFGYYHGHKSTSHNKKRNSRTQDNGKKPASDKCYYKAPEEGWYQLYKFPNLHKQTLVDSRIIFRCTRWTKLRSDVILADIPYLLTHGILYENSVTRHSPNNLTSVSFLIKERNILSQYSLQIQTPYSCSLFCSRDHPACHLCQTTYVIFLIFNGLYIKDFLYA